MVFDLQARTASLSVGELADFLLGPRDRGGGAAGLWRAQLGTHWHQQLRLRAQEEFGPAAEFELPITGQVAEEGWVLTLTGRIDQVVRAPGGLVLREIKSVLRALPADETELRAEFPGYVAQAAAYAALARYGALRPASPGATPPPPLLRTELVFVEAGSGLAQTLVLGPTDEAQFRVQLRRVTEFLTLRARSRARLQALRYHPPFAAPRPGQETTTAELTTTFSQHPLVFLEAPTGFGKTGVLLEFALGQLKSGHFDRALYLTSKATGQLQVVQTLARMTPPSAAGGTPVAAWHVRNKAEHCVNTVFHCVRGSCGHLEDLAARWERGGLARFHLDEHHARDIDTLRAAGRHAGVCPYEITRTALAFHDVWIGDYNYVFAPRNRSLFHEQPGFDAARTLLVVDEAHNLPARVADAHSQAFTSAAAHAVRDQLFRCHVPSGLSQAWDHWCHFLHHLRASPALGAAGEEDALDLWRRIADQASAAALDYAALGPEAADALWSIPSLREELSTHPLPRLWWSPRDGELHLTCLDAATAIGATLRTFGGVVLASATLTPTDGFATACGLDAAPATAVRETPPRTTLAPDRLGDLTKRDTRRLFRQLTSGADLLRAAEEQAADQPVLVPALTPWRDGSYAVAFDARVDTRYEQRSQHHATTAATVVRLAAATPRSVAVFFPSYAYAEAVAAEVALIRGPTVALQPKLRDLAAQSAWVEAALGRNEALFLVLGSSFAEGIDALGGRVTHALVVGPALPEVNAVQRARLAESERQGASREEAFLRVYQLPGMIKVNQALGRLVRAPGHSARILLHCKRFLEPRYRDLLAPEYREGPTIASDADLSTWLGP